MTVTVTDVAARAGVSRSAVSRTFTRGGTVSPGMRARVEAAATELGYRPYSLAAALKTGRSGLVALVIDDFHSPHALAAQAALTEALEAEGRRAVLVNLSGETNPARAVARLAAYHADGALLVASRLPAEIVAALAASGRPMVRCFPHGAEPQPADAAGIDNGQAGRMAARKLTARGYRRLAFVGGPKSWPAMQDRLGGFRSAARARDLDLAVQWAEEASVEAGEAAVERLLARDGSVDGFFCADDRLALGALAALSRAGIAVPETAGVIGLGNLDMSALPQFRLSTLRLPVLKIARAATARLTALIEKPEDACEIETFSCQFVDRGTLRPPQG